MSKSMMNGGKILILIILTVLAGCDWFDEAVEANLPPETDLLECGAPQGVTEGDDVRFVWGGSDIDGHVSGFEVSFDAAPWEPTPLESLTVSEITLGEHVFKVRAVDDDGDVDPDPAQCSFTASAAGRLVDRIVLLKLFTTNECPNCPKAEIALNALVDEMDTGAVSVVAYHDRPKSYSPDSDALATGQTDQRIAWYTGDPGFPGEADAWPTVVFDGLRIVVGARTAEEAEAFYRSEISLREDVGTPISLRVEGDIDADQGSVTVVARAEDLPPGGSLVLRFAVVEDSVKYRGYWANRFGFVARLLLEDEALGFVAVGDSARVEREFMVDPSWTLEKLDVIAFVQDTGTREILQSGRLESNSGAGRTFGRQPGLKREKGYVAMKQLVMVKTSVIECAVLAVALLAASAAVGAPYDFEFTADTYAVEDTLWAPEYFDLLIRNTGTTVDTIDLVVTKDAPPGWSASLCIDGMCIGTTGWVYLGPNETENLSVLVYNRGVAEMGLGHITGTMRGGGVTKMETFAAFIAVPSILLVDDDAGGTYETYMDAALDSAGYDAHVWDADARGRPGAARLASYREVLWTTADGDASYLTGSDEDDMMTFLDGGGNLCLASMGFLSSRGGATTFTSDYLHLASWTNDVGGATMLGVPGSPIGDGMSLDMTGGPFSASETDGTEGFGGPGADSFFESAAGDTTGIGVEENGHKLVFLAFPFEDVPVGGADPDNQKTLMARIMDWFDPPVAGVDDKGFERDTVVLGQNSPNPFTGSTFITFAVPRESRDAGVEIYNVHGRVVRTLTAGPTSGAEASVVWDGKDAAGKRVASGVYFYRVNTGGSHAIKKMVLLE